MCVRGRVGGCGRGRVGGCERGWVGVCERGRSVGDTHTHRTVMNCTDAQHRERDIGCKAQEANWYRRPH